jgi:hypothetical protein
MILRNTQGRDGETVNLKLTFAFGADVLIVLGFAAALRVKLS